MPSPESTSLRNGPLHAVFSPTCGGRVMRLSHDLHGDILVPLEAPSFDPLHWRKAGAFPLIPFHNRLAGAGFVHRGRRSDLIAHPAFGGDAMHGPAHRRAWTVTFHQRTMLELTLRYEADDDWPYEFLAKQRFHLMDDALHVELALVNTGAQAMPGGLGWHPYFAATLADIVMCDASRRWSVDAVPRGTPPSPRDGNGPVPASRVTEHLSDWSHATIVNGRVRVTLTADAFLPHLVIHRTPAYICLEPVSHVAGAYGFPPAMQHDAGLVSLEPGQVLSGNLSLAIVSG